MYRSKRVLQWERSGKRPAALQEKHIQAVAAKAVQSMDVPILVREPYSGLTLSSSTFLSSACSSAWPYVVR